MRARVPTREEGVIFRRQNANRTPGKGKPVFIHAHGDRVCFRSLYSDPVDTNTTIGQS